MTGRRMFDARVEEHALGFVVVDRGQPVTERLLGDGLLVFESPGHARLYAEALNAIEFQAGTRLFKVEQRALALTIAREEGRIVELVGALA